MPFTLTEVVSFIVGLGGLIFGFANRRLIPAQIMKLRTETELLMVQKDRERELEIIDLRKYIDQISNERDKTERELDALRREYDAYKESSDAQLERLHNRTESIRKQNDATLEMNVMLNEAYREKQNEIAVLTKQLIEKNAELEGKNAMILQLNKRIEHLENNTKQNTTQIRKVTDELNLK